MNTSNDNTKVLNASYLYARAIFTGAVMFIIITVLAQSVIMHMAGKELKQPVASAENIVG